MRDSIVGSYRIVGPLGTGGMGTVGAPRDREPPAVTAIVDGNHVSLAVQGAF